MWLSGLMLSVSATSTVAEGVVLHQHGARRMHLHVVGRGDLAIDLSLPVQFGHGVSSGVVSRSSPQRVRTLLRLATGSVYVNSSSESGSDVVGAVAVPSPAAADTAYSLFSPVRAASASSYLIQCARTASSAILLRNHTLLL